MSVRATEASCLFVFAHDTKFMWQTFRENLNKILNNGQISYLFFLFVVVVVDKINGKETDHTNAAVCWMWFIENARNVLMY